MATFESTILSKESNTLQWLITSSKQLTWDIAKTFKRWLRSLPSSVATEVRISDKTGNDLMVEKYIMQSWWERESGKLHDLIEHWEFWLNDVLLFVIRHVDKDKQERYFDAIMGIADMQLQLTGTWSDKYKLDKKTVATIESLQLLIINPTYKPLFRMSTLKKGGIASTIALASVMAFSTLNSTTNESTPVETITKSAPTLIIQQWDTLYNISHDFGITVDELKKLNNMTWDVIHVGQKLIVPE